MQRLMIQQFDHLTICVEDLESGMDFYSRLYGVEFYDVEPLALRDWGIGRAALCCADIELVEPVSPDTDVAKFLQGKTFMREGEAILAMAFKVVDLEQAIQAVESKGIRLIEMAESRTRKVATFHPDDAYGAMIKLVEYIPFPTRRDVGVGTLWRMAKHLPEIPEPPVEKPRMKINSIDHFVIRAENRDEAVDFFTDLFGTRHFGLGFLEPIRSRWMLPPPEGRRPAGDGQPRRPGPGPIDIDIDRNVNLEVVQSKINAGLSSIAYLVSNYEETIEAMEAAGMRLTARIDWDNRRVVGFSPPGGQYRDLIAEVHDYRPLIHRITALEMAEELTPAPES